MMPGRLNSIFFEENPMNNINVISYVLADYKINEVFVDICFTSGVVEAFYTKKNLMAIEEGRLESDIFDEVFNIIKGRVKSLNTYEVWYDLIEYENRELVWKSRYDENKEIMYVEVLLVDSEKATQSTVH